MKYLEPIPGFRISNVALGCMRIANLEETRLNSLIDVALESGVNFVDHADIYGDGDCETRYGALLRSRPELRKKIFIQTKFGICKGYYDSSKEHILFSVESSLRRLGVDHLDVLLIHRPDALSEPEEIAEAFGELYASGKVRFFGVSNHNPSQVALLQEAVGPRLIINQLQLSIMHSVLIDHGIYVNTKFEGATDRDGNALEWCRTNHSVLQVWSPFQFGFFDGPFVGNEKFPELNQVLTLIAHKYNITETGIAAAWITRIPALMQVISGTTSPSRFSEIVTGANTRLERPDWYKIYSAAGNKLP